MNTQLPDILIVDGSDEILWAMANVLEREKFLVEAVTTGRDALEKLKEIPQIKLLIMNYLLPDMSGLKMIKELKSKGSTISFIVVTAFGDHEVLDALKFQGAVAILEKPYDINELIKICTHVLGNTPKAV